MQDRLETIQLTSHNYFDVVQFCGDVPEADLERAGCLDRAMPFVERQAFRSIIGPTPAIFSSTGSAGVPHAWCSEREKWLTCGIGSVIARDRMGRLSLL
jgi:hypothetical protein